MSMRHLKLSLFSLPVQRRLTSLLKHWIVGIALISSGNLTLAGVAIGAPVELIQNGEFNSLFANWSAGSNQASPFEAAFLWQGSNLAITNSDFGQPAWFLRNVNSNYFGIPTQPINGNTAYNGFDGSPGIFWLRQNISGPAAVSAANLSFTYATQSSYGGQTRIFDVNLLDGSNNIVANLYKYTLPFSEIAWIPTTVVSLDITPVLNAFAGLYTQIEFRETVPEAPSMLLLGLGILGFLAYVRSLEQK